MHQICNYYCQYIFQQSRNASAHVYGECRKVKFFQSPNIVDEINHVLWL